MYKKIKKVVWWRFTEMLIACLVLSVLISLLCISGLMPYGSFQRDCVRIGVPVIYFVWNFMKLRNCYLKMKGSKNFYVANLYAYVSFTLVNIAVLLLFSRVLYTWLFSITGFLKYANLDVSTGTSIIFFHIIIFLSIFLAPIGLGWVIRKRKERKALRRELRERAPGVLKVNPLEKKDNNTDSTTIG